MKLNELIGKEVTLTGLAKDAKAGAAVIKEGEYVVYIGGLYEWPSEFFDKEVEITGMLNYVKLTPDPVVDQDGAISTGAYGKDYVIENAKYSVKE